MNGWIVVAVLVLLGSSNALTWSYTHRTAKAAGIAECQAERVANAEKAQTAIDLRDTSAATNRVDMLDLLRLTIPPIEIKTHETVERIRTVYKDRVVSSDCAASVARDDRVRGDLNAARDRANAAVSGLRLGKPVASSSDTGMAPDGRVGRDYDGPVRDSGQSAERIQPLPVWLEGIGRYPVAP